MMTRAQVSGFNFSHPSIVSPVLGTFGLVAFDTPSPENLIADAGLTARLDLQITWAVYDPLVASIPVEGAQIARRDWGRKGLGARKRVGLRTSDF